MDRLYRTLDREPVSIRFYGNITRPITSLPLETTSERYINTVWYRISSKTKDYRFGLTDSDSVTSLFWYQYRSFLAILMQSSAESKTLGLKILKDLAYLKKGRLWD